MSRAKAMNLDLNSCPTCFQKETEQAPGIKVWPASTYKLYGDTHPCHCQWQDELRRHYLLAEIPTGYWTLSEKDFFGDSNALAITLEYIDRWHDWKRHGMGVQFYSPILGTGKTMLASMIAKALIVKGERVHFTSFLDTLKMYDKPFEVRNEQEGLLRNSTVLILDEVRASISEAQRLFYASELENLIRFRTAGNSVTIVTTNMTPDELEDQYPRCFSLLAPKQRYIQVNGKDVRKSGDVDLLNQEFILNGESRPITPDLND